ncbi:hypothetical protein EIP86_001968 [Pleurotus ostreatoroseus]|nr:hypothetical protein EIP86_001968 [Pleurotus ostreatoroseus]
MLPNHPGTSETMKYLEPIIDAYKANAYAGMETAIFPSYFHGKCQQESLGGQDPPGCPNPDCPVVCGTPGSLVHFYGKLRYIAFNQTRHLLKTSATPGQDSYMRSEQMVVDAANAHAKRMLSMRMFYARAALDGTTPAHEWLTARADDVKTQFKQIMAQLEPLLLNVCGGSNNGETDGLPDCSWEDPMKAYILSFP